MDLGNRGDSVGSWKRTFRMGRADRRQFQLRMPPNPRYLSWEFPLAQASDQTWIRPISAQRNRVLEQFHSPRTILSRLAIKEVSSKSLSDPIGYGKM